MFSRKLWLGLGLGLFLAVALLLALLPYLSKKILISVLQDNLQGAATIEKIDIDLRHGVLEVLALHATDDAALTLRNGKLRADLSLRALFSGDLVGEIELNDATVDYGDLVVKLERFYFSGALATAGSDDAPEWLVRGDLAIDALGLFDRVREITLLSLGEARISNAEFNTATLAVSIPGLTLAQIAAVNTGSEDSRWLYGEHIAITGLDYSANSLIVEAIEGEGLRSAVQITAEGELHSQGVLSASLEALAGDPAAGDPAAGDPAAGDPDQASFNYAIGSLIARNSEVNFVSRQSPQPLALDLLVDELTLTSLNSRPSEQEGSMTLKSRVGEDSHYGDLRVKLAQLDFNGTFLHGGSEEAPEWQVQGDLDAEALGLFDTARELTLLSLGAARVQQATFNSASGAVEIPRLTLNQLGAVNTGSQDTGWLYGQDIEISALRFADNLLTIEAIQGSGVRSSAQLNAAGELESQGVLSASLAALSGDADMNEGGDGAEEKDGEKAEETAPETVSGTAPESAPETAPVTAPVKDEPGFNYAIGRITAIDSELHFADQQISPVLTMDLQVEEMSLSPLDSREPQQTTRLTFKSRLDEYSRIDLAGSLTPLAKQMSLDIKGNIKALPLPLVSPYIEKMLGYELSAGQFDHDFDIKIEDESLTASNHIDLRKLKVTKVEDVKPTAPLGIPLDMGLDMLRDKQGNIALDVPLSGRLDDPSIGVAQIISSALTKALTSGSTTFLKLALQPYGAIWMGAEMGLKAATQVKLDPMTFPPLSAELGGEPMSYAAKLGDLLGERPAMNLTLCGMAGAEDHAALALLPVAEAEKTDLLALAKQRSSALKAYLVNDKQVDPQRLIVCKPAVDPKGKISGISLEL